MPSKSDARDPSRAECILPAEQLPLIMVTTVDLGALSGPAVHFLNLARQLAAIGHAIIVVSPKPGARLAGSLVGGVTVRHAANMRRWRLPNTLNLLTLGLEIWRLKPSGKTLYVRSSPATVALGILSRRLGIAQVVVEHNGWLSDEAEALGYSRPMVYLMRILQRAEAHSADRIRVVTPGLKAILAGEGVDVAKVAVIGNGSDTCQFRPLDSAQCRRELGIVGDVPLLTFVGNLWPAVDLIVVFEAMALLKRRGVPTRIVIAGGGVRRAQFEEKARILLGEGVARFLGHVSPEKTNIVINAADVAVAPFHRARNERIGLSPLKIRDYAAAGRACVATELGGIQELRDEPWMFLARAEDASSCADAIVSALAADRAAVSKSARAYAEKHYDWSVVARRVSDLIA